MLHAINQKLLLYLEQIKNSKMKIRFINFVNWFDKKFAWFFTNGYKSQFKDF